MFPAGTYVLFLANIGTSLNSGAKGPKLRPFVVKAKHAYLGLLGPWHAVRTGTRVPASRTPIFGGPLGSTLKIAAGDLRAQKLGD